MTAGITHRLRRKPPINGAGTILMVTPFAPYRDGISVYAQQELRRLRRQGHEVEVLSPTPSAAHHHLPLGGPKGAVELAAMVGGYDRVIVQFAPEFLFGRCRTSTERALVWGALTSVASRVPLELRLHEVIYEWLRQGPVERNAARLALKAADRVTVHTEVERSGLIAEVGSVATKAEVIDHGACFVKRVDVDRSEAKGRLGLAQDEFAALCIGFLQFSKGFDRAVEAVAGANRSALGRQSGSPLPPIHLHIVGAGRVDSPEIVDYVNDLRSMCRHSPSSTLHERFVSDLEFDMWLAAADAVILPYRQIWSSGVVERARLFGAPLISSDLPQLIDQLPANGTACASIDQMSFAVLDAVDLRQAGTDPIPVGPPTGAAVGSDSDWIVDVDRPDRQLLQKQIRIRAELQPDEVQPPTVAYRKPGLSTPLAELAALTHVPRPEPASARPGVSQVKQAVHRLTSWQVDPLAKHVDDLQAVVVQTVLELENQLNRAERADVGATESVSVGTSADDKLSVVRDEIVVERPHPAGSNSSVSNSSGSRSSGPRPSVPVIDGGPRSGGAQ